MPTPISTMSRRQFDAYNIRTDKLDEIWHLSKDDYRQLAIINNALISWTTREINGEIYRDEDTNKCFRRVFDPKTGKVIGEYRINDRETGLYKRATAIANRNQGWIYFQGDCRGCMIYFYRTAMCGGPYVIGPDDNIASCYSTQALACHF